MTLERIETRIEELDPVTFLCDRPDLGQSTGLHQTLDHDGKKSAQHDADLKNVLTNDSVRKLILKIDIFE